MGYYTHFGHGNEVWELPLNGLEDKHRYAYSCQLSGPYVNRLTYCHQLGALGEEKGGREGGMDYSQYI